MPEEANFLAPSIISGLVRIGAKNDGGYVIPEDLIHRTEILISLGINDDWSFDEDFKNLNSSVSVHAYDHTISNYSFKIAIIKRILSLLRGKSSFKDVSKSIGTLKKYITFFSGNSIHYQSKVHNRKDSASDVTIDEIFNRTLSNSVFLKIDIESSEYRLIDSLLKYKDRIIGMAIEFHDTDPLRIIFINSMKKLLLDFEIVHLHANNSSSSSSDGLPEVLEISFARRGDFISLGRRTELPIPNLDHPNDITKQDFSLKFKNI